MSEFKLELKISSAYHSSEEAEVRHCSPRVSTFANSNHPLTKAIDGPLFRELLKKKAKRGLCTAETSMSELLRDSDYGFFK